MFNDHTYLYVEDDPMSREIMNMILVNAMGAERVTIFENSADFAQRVAALDPAPDVILLDIHVDPYDGFTMLEMLRNEPAFAEARIVALTASVMNEEVEKLRASGFDGAIGKPVSVQNFPGLIQRVLEGEAVWHVA